MSTTFFAGNDKLILVKKQADESTPVSDWTTGATALRVYDLTKAPVRTIAPLEESDASTQESASHVTTIGPALTFGVYGRPSELDLIAEALLGANDDSSTSNPTTHTATPTQDTPYYGLLEVDPFANTRYDGCRLGAAQFTAQDQGQTEFRVTGLAWMAKTILHGVSTPSPMPTPADELPFIYAEATVKYAGTSEGRTSAFQINVNRNLVRAQGDSGFEALALVNTKLQVDGQVTRYVADDDSLRQVDTGTAAGTVPTATIFTEPFSVLFDRGSGTDNRQFLIASTEVAYETREQALALDGAPVAEVLGFRTQPQADVADNISIVTVNAKTTP